MTKIIPGGSADLDGKLAMGDRLISVNDYSLEYVTHDDAVAAIASIVEQYNEIVLRVGKITQSFSPLANQAANNNTSNQQALQQLQEISKLVKFIFLKSFLFYLERKQLKRIIRKLIK